MTYVPSIDDAVWYDALRIAGETLGEIIARTSGEGQPVSTERTAADPDSRRRELQRERLSRYFGHLSPEGWKDRFFATGEGVYDPATIDNYTAEAMLHCARAYVRRHTGARYDRTRGTVLVAPTTIGEEEQEEIVASVLFYVWTRDYTRAGIESGNHPRALWSALRWYRKTGWQGKDYQRTKDARRAKSTEPLHRTTGVQGQRGDNPASIAQAIEEAERGALRARPKNNRGARRAARRDRSAIRVEPVNQADARSVLTPTDDRPAYRPDRPTPQPTAGEGLACPWSPGCRRDTVTQAN